MKDDRGLEFLSKKGKEGLYLKVRWLYSVIFGYVLPVKGFISYNSTN